MRSLLALSCLLLSANVALASPNNWPKTSSVAPSSSNVAPSSSNVAPSSSNVATSPSNVAPSSSKVFLSSSSPSSKTSVRPPSQPSGIAKKNPKRGLAFAAGDSPGDIRNANQSASVISWQYNWANIPPAYLATSNIPFIPMQWGGGAIDQFVDAVRAQGSDVILGFNEPDLAAESNMDPVQAASLWRSYIEPLKEYGVRLGGPAITAAGTGRPWLREFFTACSNCSIDFLPVHWYGVGTSGFYDHLWSIHSEFPRYPIWVTEFADTSSNDAEVLNFMNETLRYLDETEWIERYAWFGFFRPEPDVHYNMLRADGGLNALGELYVGAGTAHTYYVSDTAYAGYRTFDSADKPGQPLITQWPALEITSAARHGWNVLGRDSFHQLLAFTMLVAGGLAGVLSL